MIRISQGDETADIRFSNEELVIISNALNEICNGVEIDDVEFATRMGAEREEVRSLLESLGSLIQ